MLCFRPLLFSIFFCVASVFSAGAQQSPVPLELAELTRIALERNLELEAQSYETRASDAQVSGAYGIYDPLAEAEAALGVSREFSNISVISTSDVNEVKYRRLNLSLSQLFPTGARASASFTNGRDDSNNDILAINPYYDSALKFSLVQPLLRDRGRTVTERGILFAIKERQISVQNLRARAFDVLSRLRNVYHNALRLRQNLEYRQVSLDLAREILRDNKARLESGVLPPVEVLEAEVGVKQRERDLLDARRAYDDALDQIALLVRSDRPVAPAELELERQPVHFSEEQGFAAALRQRPEIMQQMRRIERLDIEGEVARNQVLPRVDLAAEYSHRGLDDRYADTVGDLADDDLANWQVGVELSYPVGNRAARNELTRVRLLRRQQSVLLNQLKEEVRTEIRAALRQIEVSDKIVDVTRSGRRLAEEKLDNLLKRQKVGLATTRDVLEGEQDLAAARFDETAALADYNNAVTDYLRVSGLLLEQAGVRFIAQVRKDEDGPLLGMETP